MRWAALAALGACFAGANACGAADTAREAHPACPPIDRNGGGGVPDPPDGASLCRSGDCNYQTQDGCASDEACRPFIDNAAADVVPRCSPVGTKTKGESCEMWMDDCARGLFCFEGQCRKLCCGGDWSGCDPGESCIRQLSARVRGANGDAGVVVDADVDLCFPIDTCDVFERGSCDDEPGRECRIVDPTGAVACAPNSDLGLGAPCDVLNQCDQGLHCVDDHCRQLCRAEECGDPGCANEDDVCVHFDRDPDGVGERRPDWLIGAGEVADAGDQ